MTVDAARIESSGEPAMGGAVIHWAARYDALVWLLTLGRERSFRERLIGLAALRPGETVLDVGCGTGTLAILAARRVGPTGRAHGIDPSEEMIARSARKARKARVDVDFRTGFVQALPFSDSTFDVVLSTLMMHHLPRAARRDCVFEMRRVLKPGGRVLVVDFGAGSSGSKGLIGHLHRHVKPQLDAVASALEEGGLSVVDRGPVEVLDLFFVLAAPRVA